MRWWLIVTGVMLALLTSCHSAQRSVAVAEAPFVAKDSVMERVERVTVTRIDTVTVAVEIPAQSGERVTLGKASHLETDFAETDAWINDDGSLGHTIVNKTEGRPMKVYVPVTDNTTNVERERKVEVPVPYPAPYAVERSLTLWERIKMGAFWWLAGLIAIGVMWLMRGRLITWVGGKLIG